MNLPLQWTIHSRTAVIKSLFELQNQINFLVLYQYSFTTKFDLFANWTDLIIKRQPHNLTDSIIVNGSHSHSLTPHLCWSFSQFFHPSLGQTGGGVARFLSLFLCVSHLTCSLLYYCLMLGHPDSMSGVIFSVK